MLIQRTSNTWQVRGANDNNNNNNNNNNNSIKNNDNDDFFNNDNNKLFVILNYFLDSFNDCFMPSLD